MINRLVRWAVHNRLVVILLAAGLMAYGIYAFRKVNVEAYPDPAPAIVEVVARYPGASAEEVERQVTIPLEVALAGMPGLNITRTQSLFELCHVSCQFDYGRDPMAGQAGGAQPSSAWPVCPPASPPTSLRGRPPARSSATCWWAPRTPRATTSTIPTTSSRYRTTRWSGSSAACRTSRTSPATAAR